MPSTIRFLRNLVILGCLCYAVIWALATFVEPIPREMSITVLIDISRSGVVPDRPGR